MCIPRKGWITLTSLPCAPDRFYRRKARLERHKTGFLNALADMRRPLHVGRSWWMMPSTSPVATNRLKPVRVDALIGAALNASWLHATSHFLVIHRSPHLDKSVGVKLLRAALGHWVPRVLGPPQ